MGPLHLNRTHPVLNQYKRLQMMHIFSNALNLTLLGHKDCLRQLFWHFLFWLRYEKNLPHMYWGELLFLKKHSMAEGDILFLLKMTSNFSLKLAFVKIT